MANPSSYSEESNLFPNDSHEDENGVWHPARNDPALCWCPKDVPPESNLCERCRELRLRHSIFCESRGGWTDMGMLNVMIGRPKCDLCSLFVLGFKQIWQDKYASSAGNQTSVNLNDSMSSKRHTRGYRLNNPAFHGRMTIQRLEFDVIFKGHGVEIKPFERSFEICPKIDLGFLKASLKSCEADHSSCKESPLTTPKDMRIIDLDSMSIVEAPENCRYCALSYVWGKLTETWLTLTRGNMSSMALKNALADVSLPQTIRDAMQLCVELGERYLWVDSLCIVQDDPKFQKQQIDIMDTIYAAATFTIVAAAGNHANAGLPGVSTWARSTQRQTITIQDIEVSSIIPWMKDTVDTSVWNSRGWTYQELIFSRRCIFLTDAQAYFACNEGVQYERPARLVAESWSAEENKWAHQYKHSLRLKNFWDTYQANVTEYTSRSLTSQTDILRAFQGVMNDLSSRFSQKFHFGHPSGNFLDSLLWQPAHHSVKRVTPGLAFPSACTNPRLCSSSISDSFTQKHVSKTSVLGLPSQDQGSLKGFKYSADFDEVVMAKHGW